MISGAAAIALACATVHIVVDALMTKFFLTPIIGTSDIVTTYYMVSLFFLPLALAESNHAHINAEILYSAFNPKGRWYLDVANYLALVVFMALLTWQMALKAMSQTAVGEMVNLNTFIFLVWPARWIALIGCLAMLLVCAGRLVKLVVTKRDITSLQSEDIPSE